MKKIISTALAFGIIGSTLIAPLSSVDAASVSKAESLVKTAEQHAGALKWQISVEFTKEVKYPDMKVFNLTKDAYLKAQQEIAALTGTEKATLEKRLEDNAGIHYKRAMGYIDAITSGKKIVDKANSYKDLYLANPTSDETEKSYHELSSEIRKQAILLYRVYGKSTRDAILAKYKSPGETELNATQNVITAKMYKDQLATLIANKATQEEIEAKVVKSLDIWNMIEDEDISYSLFEKYLEIMNQDEFFVSQQNEIAAYLDQVVEITNNEDVTGFIGTVHPDSELQLGLEESLTEMFAQYDIEYQPVETTLSYLLNGEATVYYVENAISLDGLTEDTQFVYEYILRKDENGQWKLYDVYILDMVSLVE
ncbi:hypothetical protein IM538_22020 [Cytobacillus suaedae]|nr:hypothetical protein IM538_22020 [Cytobacillus suaedae]